MGADGHLNFDTKINESGFNAGLGKLGRLAAGGLSILGQTVMGVTATMGAGAAAAIKVGSDFEAQMSKVEAISGAAGDELLALSEKAKEMGSTTKFSAAESAQAMEYMAMAGWKTGDMLSGIEGIMNLAAASGEDLAVTSDIVTDALTAFGLSAADSGRFADVLAQASSNANTNVSMMGETFKYVAPVAGALGFSAEDTAIAIGLMANSGIKAGQAGTSLRSMLTRLSDPTGEVKAAMDALGVSLTDSQGNMKSLDSIMADLRNGFSGLSEAEKTQMASAIAGQEAMSGLLAIVNASDADFDKLKDSIYDCDGAAEKMAETMQNNLQGQLAMMRSAAEGLGIEIYESIKQPLTDLAGEGAAALSELTTAFREGGTEGLIEAGTKILTDLLLGIANALPGVVSTAVQVIQSLIQNLNANLPQLASAGGQILTSLNEGIISLLPSLGGLALNIVKQFAETIAANAMQMIPKGVDMLLNFIEGIISSLPELVAAGLKMLESLAEGIANALPTIIEKAPQLINDFCAQLDSLLPKLLATGLKIIISLGKGIIQSIPTIIANAGEIVKAIINVITHLNLFSAGAGIIKGLGQGLKSMFGSVLGIIKGFITKIKNPFKIDWSGIGKDIISGIAKGITGAAGRIASAVKNAAKQALNAAKSFLGIHSPSTVFRDQVGRYMAEGMGVGFEKNIPVSRMERSIDSAVRKVEGAVGRVYNGTIPQDTAAWRDESNDPDGNPIPLVINNTFTVDGEPLVSKTSKAVIKKINNGQKGKDKVRGKNGTIRV